MKKLFYKVVLVIMVCSLAVAAFYYMKYQNSQKYIKDPTLATKEEAARIVAKVGALMELPKNEQPTLATVADISKLKGQEFFARAKNGDKMLIYTGKKEIILYRLSTNKIINVAPISINSNQKEASPSATITQPSPTPVKIFKAPPVRFTLAPTFAPSSTPIPTITSTP